MNNQSQQPTAQTEAQSAKRELPEHILIAAKDLCEYMTPKVLAELVDEWCDEEYTVPLAQIALDAGVRNCGLTHLLDYIPSKDWDIFERWEDAGLQFAKP